MRDHERPKDGRQKLKLRSGYERRFKANGNLRTRERIVEKATGANRRIGFEDLTGVLERPRFGKTETEQDVKMIVRRIARIHNSLSI